MVYLDTEGNFRPTRIESIAERFGLDANETLENIIVARVYNHEQQIERARVRTTTAILEISEHVFYVARRIKNCPPSPHGTWPSFDFANMCM